VQSSLGTRF